MREENIFFIAMDHSSAEHRPEFNGFYFDFSFVSCFLSPEHCTCTHTIRNHEYAHEFAQFYLAIASLQTKKNEIIVKVQFDFNAKSQTERERRRKANTQPEIRKILYFLVH